MSAPQRDRSKQWGICQREKRREEQGEVSGKEEEETGVKEVVDNRERDRMTKEEGWVPWGGVGNRTELVSCNL